MVEKNWRDTLYIWDGIVTVGIPDDGDEKKDSPVPVLWEGSWVPVENVPDAAKAEAPKRHAFKKDIDANCEFQVTGTASKKDRFFVAKLTKGEGWEMEDGDTKKRYHDATHDVWIKNLKWNGNQKDETESLVVAKGENEFGPFVSAGWMRPGCRWTVARRYLSESDPRAKLSFQELYDTIVDGTIEDKDGDKNFKVLPWQTKAMHVDYQGDKEDNGGGKRQKTE
mmetsp:Transcript_17987/g.44773  ORF Transcript_17987/g.44773 Transcript_17987/m.44773 type:complete len:224 (-) Transcript_17987:306-977(-)|eukprot:CAMPEP_0116096928 /NCGR_PEP_ID=MMETSP0327-20121206/10443_1 /TAXON_ID=44447 /ORGANISM="Pseudo-nitzschia delicatissima, Strain B596" /LENGTH=223 /DNA_ID=CAMNT_0003588665 /DNA_START=79 /DNA_END=750 /DNA_ORIENTATION=-